MDLQQEARREVPRQVATWIDIQDVKLVILTGGEPLLQEVGLFEVIKSVKTNKRFQFETNGTRFPQTLVSTMQYVSWVVSPKLGNNQADSPERRIRFDVLKRFVRLPNTAFKFVVSTKDDIEAVRNLDLPNTWLMAEGTTSEQLNSRMSMIIEACIRYNWNYSDRLHIRAWGDQRGR